MRHKCIVFTFIYIVGFLVSNGQGIGQRGYPPIYEMIMYKSNDSHLILPDKEKLRLLERTKCVDGEDMQLLRFCCWIIEPNSKIRQVIIKQWLDYYKTKNRLPKKEEIISRIRPLLAYASDHVIGLRLAEIENGYLNAQSNVVYRRNPSDEELIDINLLTEDMRHLIGNQFPMGSVLFTKDIDKIKQSYRSMRNIGKDKEIPIDAREFAFFSYDVALLKIIHGNGCLLKDRLGPHYPSAAYALSYLYYNYAEDVWLESEGLGSSDISFDFRDRLNDAAQLHDDYIQAMRFFAWMVELSPDRRKILLEQWLDHIQNKIGLINEKLLLDHLQSIIEKFDLKEKGERLKEIKDTLKLVAQRSQHKSNIITSPVLGGVRRELDLIEPFLDSENPFGLVLFSRDRNEWAEIYSRYKRLLKEKGESFDYLTIDVAFEKIWTGNDIRPY